MQKDAAKVALVIIDGVGLSPHGPGNGVTPTSLPSLYRAMQVQGYAVLEASGPHVGLEEGQVGNSEVGHLTIGLGRITTSSLAMINQAFHNGEWAKHPLWSSLTGAPRVHVVGLLSDAGVHGHWRTLYQAAVLARHLGAVKVIVHPILDGVDSQAGTAPVLLRELVRALATSKGIDLGVVMGRYWFCDRQGSLEVTDVFVKAVTGAASLPEFHLGALDKHLQASKEDDFPAHLHPQGLHIAADEPVIVTSHRADRAKQAAQQLSTHARVYALITLGNAVPSECVFFPVKPMREGLAFALRERGILPVRIAEACKFPHVTYFMNGFNQCLGEQQICVPAADQGPEDRPEMSISEVGKAVVATIRAADTRAVFANLANMDQVGHVGRIDLVRRAADHVEMTLQQIASACKDNGWSLVLTSDHGNAEAMIDEVGRPLGSHTTNPVPFTVIPSPSIGMLWTQRQGGLANIAASLLGLLGIESGSSMAEPLVRCSHR